MKLVIDNQIYSEDNTDWLWRAIPLQKDAGAKRKTKKVTPNLDASIHYVEFWADHTPSLHKVILNTVISFSGNYRCHTAIRQPYGKDKEVLGVYIPSGIPDDINNNNIEVYFGNTKLKLDTHNPFTPLAETFDFNTAIFQDLGTNWFFYDIDTSWKNKHPDWRDDGKWKIIKKKTNSD